jgi:hypothetical protein
MRHAERFASTNTMLSERSVKGDVVAKQTIERLIDDLDGTDGAETVAFALDGVSYEIDLSEKNAAALRKAVDRYVRAARKTSGAKRGSRRTPARSAPPAGRNYDLVQLREWAGKNKIAIPSRGRIPAAIVEQYQVAGGQ